MSKTMTLDAIKHDRACRVGAAATNPTQLPAGATAFRWLGSILQVAGAVLLAANVGMPIQAYKLMLCGAAFWSVIATLRRDWPLLAMQAFFVVLNIVGIVRWAA